MARIESICQKVEVLEMREALASLHRPNERSVVSAKGGLASGPRPSDVDDRVGIVGRVGAVGRVGVGQIGAVGVGDGGGDLDGGCGQGGGVGAVDEAASAPGGRILRLRGRRRLDLLHGLELAGLLHRGTGCGHQGYQHHCLKGIFGFQSG
jgi:hypothetical protein